jgi:hypothetical protein
MRASVGSEVERITSNIVEKIDAIEASDDAVDQHYVSGRNCPKAAI